MKQLFLPLAILAAVLIQPSLVQAQYCPLKIAIVDGSRLSSQALPILKQVYEQLKCAPEIMALPGRRGVVHFNRSLIDGEQFRIAGIESQYKKPFIRSEEPLFTITGSIWAHPDEKISKNRPLAYVLGFAWQENYITDGGVIPATTTIKFKSDIEAMDAYNRQVIGSFMSTSQTMKIHRQVGHLTPEPILNRVISKTPVYHYLDPKFAKFMADFSEILRRDDPFADLN